MLTIQPLTYNYPTNPKSNKNETKVSFGTDYSKPKDYSLGYFTAAALGVVGLGSAYLLGENMIGNDIVHNMKILIPESKVWPYELGGTTVGPLLSWLNLNYIKGDKLIRSRWPH